MARAVMIFTVGFYAWSPPRFVAGPPVSLTVNGYLDMFWDRLPDVWQWYWGRLGWLDYAAAPGWYQLMAVLVLLNIIAAARDRPGGLARLGATFFGVYVVLMMVGEYRFLPVAGYNFQGRHLFPAMIGTAGLVLHPRQWPRTALLGGVAAINVALAVQSVSRYFGGDWLLLLRSLP
jgi:hypothetical protein